MVSKPKAAPEESTAVDAQGVVQEEVVPIAEPTEAEATEEAPVVDAGAETDAVAEAEAEPAAGETDQNAASEPEDEEPAKAGDSDEDSAG